RTILAISNRTKLETRASARGFPHALEPEFDTKRYSAGGVYMKRAIKFLRSSLILGLAVLLLPVLAFAQHYKQTNLVSDLASISTPNPPDPSLKNPWGLTRSPGGSPWWVSNNNSGTSTLYNGAGAAIPINGTGNEIGRASCRERVER